jgi:uncharacterized protein (TIGR02145 family)
MFYTKALLIVLTGISLCMAHISGVVTDSTGVKIVGAIVRLEKGGQTDTTKSDGSFILTFDTTDISNHIKAQSVTLFANIQNGILYIKVGEKAALQITTFDLTGKVISTVHQSMDVGIHFIGLPYRGAGIYLYKVKAGTNEVVLKGNSISRVSSVSSGSSQALTSSNSLTRQAKIGTAIDDVIDVTKDGYLNYRAVAYKSDTTGVAIKMIASAGTVTDIDGNVYQTVKIGNQVWMAENLRVTKYNDSSAIALDTSTAAWASDTTPRYCFYEKTADSIRNYGVLYNWYVVSVLNTKKIAPPGWHVPTDAEWTTLEKFMVLNSYNWDGTKDTLQYNKIAKSLAAKADWSTHTGAGAIGKDLSTNNRSGFTALPSGCRGSDGTFSGQNSNGGWWSTTEDDATRVWYRILNYGNDYLYRNYYYKSGGLSVRLVKD